MILTLTSMRGLEDNQAGKLVRRITPRMWGPKIAKLMNIPPITMVYGTQITILTGVFKPTFTSRLRAHIADKINGHMAAVNQYGKSSTFHR